MRQQGVIWRKTNKHYNGGHFGTRCTCIYRRGFLKIPNAKGYFLVPAQWPVDRLS